MDSNNYDASKAIYDFEDFIRFRLQSFNDDNKEATSIKETNYYPLLENLKGKLSEEEIDELISAISDYYEEERYTIYKLAFLDSIQLRIDLKDKNVNIIKK